MSTVTGGTTGPFIIIWQGSIQEFYWDLLNWSRTKYEILGNDKIWLPHLYALCGIIIGQKRHTLCQVTKDTCHS